jgi:N-acetylglucosaminylphosphatidylinositol deacetylase
MAILTASRSQDLQKRVVLVSATNIFLLVIAHPDDECMFFIPTIVSLLASTTTTNTPFYILCLSNGNYHGLGKQREKEFYNAIQVLGLDFHKVTILSDFPDNPLLDWNVELLSDSIYQHIKHIVGPCSSSQQVVSAAASEGEQHQKRITIITFDSKGVSGHRNHCSTYR